MNEDDAYDKARPGNTDFVHNLLLDIFSVQKAFMFGALKFADYTEDTFIRDIVQAEADIFIRDIPDCEDAFICSEYAKSVAFSSMTSLYPLYIIDDDMFEVLRVQFVVNSIVHELLRDSLISDDLHIHCYVIPKTVRLLYDRRILFHNEIADADAYLSGITGNFDSFEATSHKDHRFLREALKKHVSMDNIPAAIAVLSDRRTGVIYVFHCSAFSSFPELRRNHLIGIDYAISSGHSRARAWLNFGEEQRLRFYPEHLISVLPRLFGKTADTTSCKFLQRVFGDDFKHAICTDLADPIFDKFYKIITGYDHVSNNYHRLTQTTLGPSRTEIHFGLIHHLAEKIDAKHFAPLCVFLSQNHFDSEALMDDILQYEDTEFAIKRVFVDETASNIAEQMSRARFRNLKQLVFEWLKIRCTVNHILNINDCPLHNREPQDVPTRKARIRDRRWKCF